MSKLPQQHIVIDARIRRSSTGRYVDRLLEHLQTIATEDRYTVLLQPDDPWQPKAANFTRVDCKYAQFSFNPVEQIGFAWQLHQLKPDLVHFSMTQQPILYFGNIVTTTHDLTMLKYVRAGTTPLPIFWIKKLGYRFLFWWGHRKSKKIITPTKYVLDDLASMQPFTKDRLVFTHEASEPPLKVEAEKPVVLNEKWQSKNEKFIMYAGSAFPHKNLETLIKSFEIIKDSHDELFLVLTGKKEHYFEQLESFADKSPARRSIIFTSYVADEELKWLYENAEAYVFPSYSEGFGLPGLEAMAHGCPVASSSATCLPEVYGDAANYFDPHSPADMAQKVTEVLDNKKLREELVKKGHEQLKNYSWQKMANQTLDIYHSCL